MLNPDLLGCMNKVHLALHPLWKIKIHLPLIIAFFNERYYDSLTSAQHQRRHFSKAVCPWACCEVALRASKHCALFLACLLEVLAAHVFCRMYLFVLDSKTLPMQVSMHSSLLRKLFPVGPQPPYTNSTHVPLSVLYAHLGILALHLPVTIGWEQGSLEGLGHAYWQSS